jgi:hypothetical protein
MLDLEADHLPGAQAATITETEQNARLEAARSLKVLGPALGAEPWGGLWAIIGYAKCKVSRASQMTPPIHVGSRETYRSGLGQLGGNSQRSVIIDEAIKTKDDKHNSNCIKRQT